MPAIAQPFEQFFNLAGEPLQDGYLYFGAVSQNPETNPVAVFWDQALTQPAPQPIRTSNGYIYRSGSPAQLYTAADFSLTIKEKDGSLVAYAPNSSLYSQISDIYTRLADTTLSTNGAGLVGYNSSLTYPAGTVGAAIAAAANVNFTQAGTGAVTRSMQNKVREHVSITDFGADPAASAAVNSAALAAAFTYASSVNKAIYIPAGNYPINQQWVINKWVHIYGEGRDKSILTYNGPTLTGANGVIQITPPNPATSNRFYELHDFGVAPGSGTATNGIRVVLVSGAYFSNFDFYQLYIGDFSSYGMCLDNTVANTDGFFTGRIARNWITNGFQGIKIGDSMIVEQNTLTIGTLTNSDAGILISSLANLGVRNGRISDNNITCAGGAMVLLDCEQYLIENNQCEHPFYYGVNYLGSYNAFIYGYNLKWCKFSNNTFQCGAASIVGPAYCVLLEGTTNYNKFNSFKENHIYKGESYHIGFGNGCIFNVVGNNTYDSAPVITNYDDNVNPQIGIPLVITYRNGWSTHAQFTAPTITLCEDGWAVVRGCITAPSVAGDGSWGTMPLNTSVTTRARFVTNANDSDASNSVVQAYQNYLWIVTAPVTTKVGVDGMIFPYTKAFTE